MADCICSICSISSIRLKASCCRDDLSLFTAVQKPIRQSPRILAASQSSAFNISIITHTTPRLLHFPISGSNNSLISGSLTASFIKHVVWCTDPRRASHRALLACTWSCSCTSGERCPTRARQQRDARECSGKKQLFLNDCLAAFTSRCKKY